ncbi:unnamed protein product (macronuclear) [Paramecium tetraurelia]|uniref:Transmembrane protein n=1 Tax=Paramecium tetraurelia TaxID=5888 RepID=A0CHA3_PARTE|nr:uncharacterized protein GSPATT00007610001 [Paramecium tetraurelia]CAK70170.1 unnamed protein product [Paramecium tetraurelia]|eukprot:XP_001437567.1 hypothetical protein (macronuclear) [Paramecium tetraurelia strain d4-2]
MHQHDQNQGSLFLQIQANINFNLQYTLEDEHYYQLPKLIVGNFKGKRTHNNVNIVLSFQYKQDIQKLDDDLKDIAETTVLKLKDYAKVWDVDSYDQQQRYYFNIPPTSFLHKIKEFELPKNFQAYEYNAVAKLSEKQIQQMKETGTFEVPSRQFPIPYVWQISSWVIKGTELDFIKGIQNIETSKYLDLARAYKAYRTWLAYIAQDRDDLGRNISLRSAIYNIGIRPLVIFSIFFGFKEMYSYVDEQKLLALIETQRQFELKQLQNVNVELYKYLKLNPYDKENLLAKQKYEDLQQCQNEFEIERNGIRLQMQSIYDIQIEKKTLLQAEDEEIVEQHQYLQEQINQLQCDFVKKYNLYIDKNIDITIQIEQAAYSAQKQFWEKTKYPKPIVYQLISLGDCLRLYDYHYEIYQTKCNTAIKTFKEQIKQKHKIKSNFPKFVEEETRKFKKDVKKQLKQQFVSNFIADMKQLNLSEQQVYEQFQQCKKQMRENFKQMRSQKKIENKEPSIKIVVQKRLFPPYEVYQERDRYYLRRFKDYHIDSSKAGWKLKLIGIRYYVWTVNIIFWLSANAVSGPIGIKALIKSEKFKPDVVIDSTTGKVKPSNFTVTPLIVKFFSVLEGMRNSRCHFEGSPDTGLFGKNLYRVFNLIEVYIFRFLLVGVIGVIIILPTIIISNVVISTLLALTAWLWIPITIIIRILFNSLIYDTDVCRRREKDIIWRSPNWFPLIINIFDFLILGILNTIYCLFKLLIWHPFWITFMAAFAYLRFYTRSLYDSFTIIIIKLMGRVPSSENNIAWKISGPGLSRQYFYGIQLPQVLILVQAELEKKMLNLYKQNLINLINRPSQDLRQKINPFFQLFNAQFSFDDPACGYLTNQLNKQIEERLSLFPKLNHQIRFSEDELKYILKQVKSFVEKDMKSYIWDSYQVQKGDYNLLSEKIMAAIFGSAVLDPFEDLEMRFQLNISQNFDFISKVDKALDGNILFQLPTDYTIQPKKLGENNVIQKKFISYQQVLQNVWNWQSLKQSQSSLNSKRNRCLINYSIDPKQ